MCHRDSSCCPCILRRIYSEIVLRLPLHYSYNIYNFNTIFTILYISINYIRSSASISECTPSCIKKIIKLLFWSPFGVMERSREIGRRPLLGVMGGRGVFDLCISINMFHRSSSWPLALTFSKHSMRYWMWSDGRWNMRPVIRHWEGQKERKVNAMINQIHN